MTTRTPRRVGTRWVFPDGRTIPVVSGGSDEGAGDVGATDPGGDATATSSPAPDGGGSLTAAEGAPPAGGDQAPAGGGTIDEPSALDDDLSGDTGQVIPRGRYEKVVNEGRRYREQLREAEERAGRFEEAFGAYGDDDQAAWLSIVGAYADPSSREAAAEVMQEIVNNIRQTEGDAAGDAAQATVDEATDAVDEAAGADGGTLTPEQVEEIVAQRLEADRQQTSQQEQIKAIDRQLTDAGYPYFDESGEVAATAPAHLAIINIATAFHQGDIAKATEWWEQQQQSAIDEFVAGKRKNPTTPAPSDGVLASTSEPVRTMDDAKDALRRRLEGMQTTPGN